VSAVCRLINHAPAAGAWNMAVDEAILRNFAAASQAPVLRLYGWQPKALSLGRYQPVSAVNLPLCQQHDIDIVRRMSGGGAVLHGDELTYSLVCTPQQLKLCGSVKDSFRLLTSFIISFYQQLGLAPAYAIDTAATVQRGRAAFCYAANEAYDILIADEKIGGNAQRRLRKLIFQHGSIPLGDYLQTGAAAMQHPVGAKDMRATCLRKLGITATRDELTKLLAQSFSEQFKVSLRVSELSVEEAIMSEQLLATKYTNDNWTLAGEQPCR